MSFDSACYTLFAKGCWVVWILSVVVLCFPFSKSRLQQWASLSFEYRLTFILAPVFLHVLEALYAACSRFLIQPGHL